MKNTYKFVILLLFAGAFISCEKKETPPTPIKQPSEMDIVDPEFKNFLIANFDTDVDFKLSPKEIRAVKEILSSNEKIRSVDGIEIFSSLEKVYILKTQIRTIDLSKNSHLTKVVLSDNAQLTTVYLSESQRNIEFHLSGAGSNLCTVIYQ